MLFDLGAALLHHLAHLSGRLSNKGGITRGFLDTAELSVKCAERLSGSRFAYGRNDRGERCCAQKLVASGRLAVGAYKTNEWSQRGFCRLGEIGSREREGRRVTENLTVS